MFDRPALKEKRIPEDSEKIRESVKADQSRAKDIFQEIYDSARQTKQNRNIHTHEIQFTVRIGPGNIYVGPSSKVYGHAFVNPFSLEVTNDLTWFDLKFEIAKMLYDCSDASDGMSRPLMLKKCEAPKRNGSCGNFFLEAHKKEKNYCSNKCAWRAYADYVRKDKAKEKGGK